MNQFHKYATLAAFAFVVGTAPAHSQGDVPKQLNYQGVVVEPTGEPVIDGTYGITVRMYDVPTGGTPIWAESHQVTTLNGVFDVTLGTQTALDMPFDKQYWLGFQLDGEQEMMPRTAFVAVPYALYSLRAKVADSLSPDAKGVVRSVNGEDGNITIVGGGATNVTKNGKEITISTPPGIGDITSTDGSIEVTKVGATLVDLAIKVVDPAKIGQGGARAGDALVWDDTRKAWVPGNVSIDMSNYIRRGDAAGGDLTGTYPDPQIRDGAVTTPKLADGAVTTPKIGDGAVTNEKLADNAVSESKIQNNAVSTAKIQDNAVSTAKIQDNAVSTTKVQNGAVSTEKIQNKAVTGDKLTDMPLTPGFYGSQTQVARVNVDQQGRIVNVENVNINGVPPSGPAGGDLTGTYPDPLIRNNAVTTPKIADDAVTSAKIADLGVKTVDLDNGVVTTPKIADGQVTSQKMTNTGVVPNTYGTQTTVPVITVDAAGRISNVVNQPITGIAPGGNAGGELTGTYPNPTINQATAGGSIITAVNNNNNPALVIDGQKIEDPTTVPASDITSAGKLDAMNLQIKPNTVGAPELVDIPGLPVNTPVGNGTNIPVITVDADGRVVALGSTPNAGISPVGPAGGDLQGTYPNPQVNPLTAGERVIQSINNVANPAILVDGQKLDDMQATAPSDVSVTGKIDAANFQLKTGVVGANELENIPGLPAGPQGNATTIPVITVDADGRVTGVTPTPVGAVPPGGAAGGDLTGTYPNPSIANTATAGTNIISAVNNGGSTGKIGATKVVDPNAAPASDVSTTGDLANLNMQIKPSTVGASELVNLHGSPIGPMGSNNTVPVVSIDQDGRVTSLTSTTLFGVEPGGPAGGDLTGTYPNPVLVNTAVTPGIYGGINYIPVFQVDAKGRLLDAGQVPFEGIMEGDAAGGDLTGTYPNPSIANTGVAGTNIINAINNGTTTGTISVSRLPNTGGDVTGPINNIQISANTVGASEIASSGVTAGTYGSTTTYPIFTVDADGRVTSASNQNLQSAVNSMTIAGTGPDATVGGTINNVTVNLNANSVGSPEIATNAVGDDEIASSGVGAGSYGSATAFPTFTVNGDGRLTAAGTVNLNTIGGAIPASGSGDVAITGNVNAMTTTLNNNTVTSAKVVDNSLTSDDLGTNSVGPDELAAPGATANTAGTSTQFPIITYDADGRITGHTNTTAASAIGNAGGDVSGPYTNLQLNTGVVGGPELENIIVAGTIGSTTVIPTINYDENGRITSVSPNSLQTSVNSLSIAGVGPDATVGGTINNVTVNLNANSVGSPEIATDAVGSDEIAPSGVGAGTYGSATAFPTFTVDGDGRITNAGSVNLNTVGGAIPASGSGDVTITGNVNAMTTTLNTATAGPSIINAINNNTNLSLTINAEQLEDAGASLASDATVSGKLDNMNIQLKSGVVGSSELSDLHGGAIGPVGNGTTVPVVTIDQDGRVTGLTSTTITGVTPGGAAGGDLAGTYPNPTISNSATTGTNLIAALNNPGAVGTISVNRLPATGGDVSGPIDNIQINANAVGPNELAAPGATATTVGSTTAFPIISYDNDGRITTSSTVALNTIGGAIPASGSGDVTITGNVNAMTTTLNTATAGPSIINAINNNTNLSLTINAEQLEDAGASLASDATVSGKLDNMNIQLKSGVVGSSELSDLHGGAIGPVGNGTTVPVVTIDQDGRVTGLTSTTITGVTPGGAAGGDLTGTYPNPTISNSATTGTNLIAALNNPGAVGTISVNRLPATGGDVSGPIDNIQINANAVGPNELAAPGATATTVGSTTAFPIVSYDNDGRITTSSTVALNTIGGAIPASGSGDVTITGNVNGMTTNIVADAVGAPEIAASAVGASELADLHGGAIGPVGSGSSVPVVTIDADGRVTGLTSTTITGVTPGGAAGGDLAGTYPNPTISNSATTGTNLIAALNNPGAVGTISVNRLPATGGDVSGPIDNIQINANAVGPNELAPAGITAATAGTATEFPIITYDADGRITGHTNTTAASAIGNAGGDVSGPYTNLQLNSGVVGASELSNLHGGAIGPVGNGTTVPVVTIDQDGRVTGLTSTTITGVTPGGAAGGDLAGTYPNPTISNSATTGTNLIAALNNPGAVGTISVNRLPATGGDVSGPIDNIQINANAVGPNELAPAGITAATAGTATEFPIITYDADGRITGHTNTTAASAIGNAGGDVTGPYTNLQLNSGVVGAAELANLHGSAIGPVGSGTSVPVVTIDQDGRVTGLTSTTITGVTPGGAAGGDLAGTYPNPTISNSATTGTNLIAALNNPGAVGTISVNRLPATGGDVSGPIDNIQINANAVGPNELAAPGATATTVGSTTAFPIISYDNDGRITTSSTVALNTIGGAIPASGSGDVTITGNVNAMTTTLNTATAGPSIINAINNNTNLSLTINAEQLEDAGASLASDATVSGKLDNMNIQLKSGVVGSSELSDLHGGVIGPVGSGSSVPVVTIDADGRVTALSSTPITGVPPGGAAGGDLAGTYPNPTISNSATTGTNLIAALNNPGAVGTISVNRLPATGGDVSGPIDNIQINANAVGPNELAPAGAVAATAGSSTEFAAISYDADGRITGHTNYNVISTLGNAGGDVTGPYTNLQLQPGVVTDVELAGPGALAATAGTATDFPIIQYDADGRIIGHVNTSISSLVSGSTVAGNGDVQITGTVGAMVTSLNTDVVGTAEIIDNTVTDNDLAVNSVGPSELQSTSVAAGSYGSSTAFPTFTVDSDGRLTAAGTQSLQTAVNGVSIAGTGPDATVGGTINNVTVNLNANSVAAPEIVDGSVGADEIASTTVTAGAYGNLTSFPTFTVDADGRLTNAGSVNLNSIGGAIPASGAGDVTITGNVNAMTTTLNNNSVTSAKVVDNSLTSDDLGTNSVGPDELGAPGATANTAGSSTQFPMITYDADGRITGYTNTTVASAMGNAGGDVSGPYTNLDINPNTIGPNELQSTTVTAGSYGSVASFPTFTVDADGRITAAATQNLQTAMNGVNISGSGPDITVGGTINAVATSINANAVNSAKVLDNSLTSDDLGTNSVGPDELAAPGATAVTVGSSTAFPIISYDNDGRITTSSTVALSSIGNAIPASGSGDVNITGNVGSMTTAFDVTKGNNMVTVLNNAATTTRVNADKIAAPGVVVASDITVTGDLNAMNLQVKNDAIGAAELASTTVTAGTYGSATQVPQFTVDADGRLTGVNVLTISGGAPSGTAGGDLIGSYPSPSVAKIQGYSVATTAPALDDVLTWTGTQWKPASKGTLNSALRLGGLQEYDINAGVVNNLLLNSDISILKLIDAPADCEITGFDGGTNGRVLLVVNKSGKEVSFKKENAGSNALNRIGTPTTDLDNDKCVMFIYIGDGVTGGPDLDRWYLVSAD